MDIAKFRIDFPEFGSATRYPSSQITFWATVAETQVNLCAWGDAKPFGVELYVAHELILATQNLSTASKGGVPGTSSGPVNSKTVGNATISYDAAQTAEKDAGWWNLSNYGRQFIRLARMYGAWGIQL